LPVLTLAWLAMSPLSPLTSPSISLLSGVREGGSPGRTASYGTVPSIMLVRIWLFLMLFRTLDLAAARSGNLRLAMVLGVAVVVGAWDSSSDSQCLMLWAM